MSYGDYIKEDLYRVEAVTIKGEILGFIGKTCSTSIEAKNWSFDNFNFARFISDKEIFYFYRGKEINVR